MKTVKELLGADGIIPVVTVDDVTKSAAIALALSAGNLPCAEVTFRTTAAAEAITRMLDACPDMCVGAGTVLTIEQAEAAAAAGAQFVITPGFDDCIVDWCLAADMPVIPGVMTPTELNHALRKGIELVKFFPAEAAGGVLALQAIGAPYAGMRFVPTGGVSVDNLADYLGLPMVHACGGTWIANSNLIADSDFAAITNRAVRAVAIATAVRPATQS